MRLPLCLCGLCLLVLAETRLQADEPPAAPVPETAPVPPPAAPRAGEPPAPAPGDPGESEIRRKRQELDQRKADLPKEAAPALLVLEEFHQADFRMWANARRRVVAFGQAAVPALVLMLEETDWEVRAFSAACLQDVGDAGALGVLETALAKEQFVEARRRMVGALASFRLPAAERALLAAASDPDPGISLWAIRGLGALGRVELIPALEAFASSKNLDIRFEVLGSLAALGAPSALQQLDQLAKSLVSSRDAQRVDSMELFDHGDRYQQYLLGLAMARSSDEKVNDLLKQVLELKKPWERKLFLRLGAAEGLGRRAAAGGSLHPALVRGLGHDDASVRVACAYGLGFVRDPDLVKPLARALSDSQLDVSVNVVRALGQIGTADAVKALRKAVRDRTAEIRVAAVRALAEVHDPAATDALLDALKDEKYVLRVLAARALGQRAAEPRVVEALSKVADDPDYGVREQVLASLSQARGQAVTVLPTLVRALRDDDSGVQANACLAIAHVLQPEDAPTLLDELVLSRIVRLSIESPVLRLQRAAVEALDSLRPLKAVPLLLAALESEKGEVRRRAHSVLQRISERQIAFVPAGTDTEMAEGLKRWRTWWETGPTLPRRVRVTGPAVTGSLVDQARDLKWRGVDIALLLDSTGSMAGLLRAAKQAIDEVLAELDSPLPSLRVALYTYRDVGDNYVFYGTPLTFDVDRLPGFLQSFVHGQGGDIPEAVRDTVAGVMRRLEWRPDAHKVIIFAGDAPHHPEEDSAFRQELRAWATPANRAVVHALFTDTNRRSMDIARRKEREDPDAFQHPYLDIYRKVAELGRGRAVLLSDESTLIREILVLAFGPAWRAEIEAFLDFRT